MSANVLFDETMLDQVSDFKCLTDTIKKAAITVKADWRRRWYVYCQHIDFLVLNIWNTVGESLELLSFTPKQPYTFANLEEANVLNCSIMKMQLSTFCLIMHTTSSLFDQGKTTVGLIVHNYKLPTPSFAFSKIKIPNQKTLPNIGYFTIFRNHYFIFPPL